MIDQRQRTSLMILTLIYLFGWMIGRAGGRADASAEMLQAYAARTPGS